MNCIEIFSGGGGMAKGLELAGADHLAFVEWNKDACNTLRANFPPEKVFEGDVRGFPFSAYRNVDVIAGGPPCQPFSLGGKARGSEDVRDMFPAAVQAIRALRPKAFIFENVKGLLRRSFAEYFRYILLQLAYPQTELHGGNWRDNLETLRQAEERGTLPLYRVSHHLVNAADYGVPQTRERVIIVGFRADMGAHWEFPAATHSKDRLLWELFVTGCYWKRHGVTNHLPPELVAKEKARLLGKYGKNAPALRPWRTVRDALAGLGEPDGQGDHRLRPGAKEYPGHTGSCLDFPSKTIKAGGHGVPGGENMLRFPDGRVRYCSVAEAKRLQTFPDGYTVTGAWSEAMRQLGNAVPVELARRVAQSVIAALGGAD